MSEAGDVIFSNPIMVESAYMLSSVFFILSLGGLSNPESSKRGNLYGMYGITIAIIATLFSHDMDGRGIIKFAIAMAIGGLIGIRLALTVEMIAMPQLVAALHSFVGIAATVVGYGSFYQYNNKGIDLGTAHSIELFLGVFIGTITFVGSVVAYGKLKEIIDSKPLIILGSFRHVINLTLIVACAVLCGFFVKYPTQIVYLAVMTGLALILGWHLIMAIGGADMPVVVSMLNSYSGWATAASGFMLGNNLLVISGALVGSSGAILSYIMCKGMNRSFVSVIAGGFGLAPSEGAIIAAGSEMQETNLDEVVEALKSARSVIIVPGYGMAASRCQNEIGRLAKELRSRKINCRFCIHPVAGRLPGHMNVLLAEAGVPYNYVEEMEHINDDFPKTDVVLVVGANDTVNPDALENPRSVLAGMPVCEVWKAKTVFAIKRSKGTGYAAIENSLFYKPNCKMFFGNAKDQIRNVLNAITKDIPGATTGGDDEVKTVVQYVKEVEEDMTPYLAKCSKIIGIPKEVQSGERRVAITPAVAKKLIKLGFKVKIEASAGEGSGFMDKDYEKVGVQVVSVQDLWDNSEIIVKVKAPAQNSKLGRHEADALKSTELLISYLYPAFNAELLQKLTQNKPDLSVLALDCTPRISRAQKLDTLSSQTGLAGYRAVIEAFHEFPKFSKPFSSAAGSIPPSTVLIMGAGVAGLAAIALARSLGAVVRAFDTRAAAKEQVESLGGDFLEVDYKESGEGGGGYAKEMSAGYQLAQKQMIQKQAREVDVIITTALIPGRKAPILLDAETVSLMKPNSVIVDMAAEMGGNCELTKPGQIFVEPKNRVSIIGYTDLHSRMAKQSSELFATNMYNLFEELCFVPKKSTNTAANLEVDRTDEIVKGMCVIHNGQVVWSLQQAPPQVAQKSIEVKAETHPNQVEIRVDKNEEKLGLLEQGKENIEAKANSEPSAIKQSAVTTIGLVAVFVVLGFIPVDHSVLLNRFFVFILAIFIGYMVIWNVTASLHTPLMSVTNAISGIIIVGSMLELSSPAWFEGSSICGSIGVFFASINVFGGFIVTQRMLNMFKSL